MLQFTDTAPPVNFIYYYCLLLVYAVVGVRVMDNVCRRHQQQEVIFDSVEI